MSHAGKILWQSFTLLAAISVSMLTPAFLAAAPVYEIQGVAVSSRNGAPVPFCRLSVEVAPSNTPIQSGSGSGQSSTPRFSTNGRTAQRSVGRPNAAPPRTSKNEVVADAAGHFTVEVPEAGSWRLLGVARGFHSQIFEEHQGFYTAIVLTPSAPIFHATFRMTPDASIAGVLLDEAGEPVRLAQVFAERVAPELPGESNAATGGPMRQVEAAMTDDRGHYELAGLAPGNYLVRVQAQPWYASSPGLQRSLNAAGPTTDPSLDVAYATTWFPAADSEAQAQPLALTGGEERQADFHLNPIPAVHLQIPQQVPPPAAETGRSRPQRQATINRVSADGSGLFDNMTYSTGGGAGWEFSGLTPGIYEVHLPSPDGQSDGETRQIEVRSGASGFITLEGSTPLTRLTVQVDGVPDSEVSSIAFVDTETGRSIFAMAPPGRRGRRPLDSDEEGADDEPSPSRIALLPPHTYDIVVNARSDAYLAGLDATGAKTTGTRVTIAGGTPMVRLHVARGRGTVSGFALMPDHPAEGSLVLLVPITLGTPGNILPVLRDQANSDGSFRLTAVTPGKYILLAIDHGWDVNWKDLQSLERYLLKGTALDLHPGSKLTETIQAQMP